MNLANVDYVESLESLYAFQKQIEHVECLGLDTETTSLDPFNGRVRLLVISDGTRVWIVDNFKFPVSSVMGSLQGKHLIAHNALFDFKFLASEGFWPSGPITCTLLLSQVLYAGLKADGNKVLSHSLQAVAKRELQLDVSKELQKSDWSGALSPEQIEYAARDAQILPAITESLYKKIHHFKLDTAVSIELRCFPAILWMSMAGIPFNWPRWKAVAEHEELRATQLEKELNASIFDILEPGEGVNWRSPQQVKKVFSAIGIELSTTKFEVISAIEDPVAKMLTQYREAEKRIGTYGKNWEEYVKNGRIYPQWGQCFTVTGRMSSNSPNFQNLPRSKQYRECIEASPGRKLVIADYSMIEVRIAAKLADEKRLIEAFHKKQDVHKLTASIILNKHIDEITKDERQIGKSCVFALIYGAGAERLRQYAQSQFSIAISLEEATIYRNKFFEAFPGIRRWHKKQSNEPVTTRSLSGRWRIGVENYSEKLNSPDQSTGADGLKLALALLWERRIECPASYPVIAAHDEIVIETTEKEAEKAKSWLIKAMKDGIEYMLHPIPVEVEATIAQNWSEK